jgi:Ca2+-binding RTX toxin-like protein
MSKVGALARTRAAAMRVAVVAILLAAGSSLDRAATAVSDVPTCLGRPATIVGTNGNERLRGTAGNDVIAGLAGDDFIDNQNKAGVDVICGGEGNDEILGSVSTLVSGDAGDDRLAAAAITYQESPVSVRVDVKAARARGWGSDSLSRGLGSLQLVIGSQHGDVLMGASAAAGVVLVGLDGNDSLLSRQGRDELFPGAGDDLVDGGSDSDCDTVSYGAVDFFGKPVLPVAGSPAPVRVDLAAGIVVGWGRDRLRRVSWVVGSRFGDVLLGSTRRGRRDCADSLFGLELEPK